MLAKTFGPIGVPLTRYWKRYVAFNRLMLERHTKYRLESCGAIVLAFLGIWLFFAHDLLSYRFLATIAPQQAWGVLFVLIALSSRAGISIDNYRLRQLGTFLILLCQLFLLTSVYYGTGGISSTLPGHAAMVVVNTWALLRMSR